jgi:hypothetical protein
MLKDPIENSSLNPPDQGSGSLAGEVIRPGSEERPGGHSNLINSLHSAYRPEKKKYYKNIIFPIIIFIQYVLWI